MRSCSMADRTQSQDDPKCLKTEVNEEQIEPYGDILGWLLGEMIRNVLNAELNIEIWNG